MNYCNAILYMSQISELSETKRVKGLIDQCYGVVNTMLGQATPKLLLVDYDPAQAKMIDLVNFLKSRGIIAKIVGL